MSKGGRMFRFQVRQNSFLANWTTLLLLTFGASYAGAEGGTRYHVFCQLEPSGLVEQPLRGLDAVNSTALLPGDTLAFQRGDTCIGTLTPKGSGSASSPIRIQAEGTGPRPRIEAPEGARQAILLQNQSYWEIGDLDVAGGTQAGLSVSASEKIEHHIHISNTAVHGVRGELKAKASGLIVVEGKLTGSIDDVSISNSQIYNTTLWAGVFVSGSSLENPLHHVSVRNTMVHDVQGDGIVLFNVSNGEIRNSVAWHTGMQSAVSVGTPNAIWTWHCSDCEVLDNEAFLVDSPGVDGGAYDIDYEDTRTLVSRNFGHDTREYCVSIFAGPESTVDSTISDNTCLLNGLSPRLAARQGAFFFMSWAQGKILNASVTRNTLYWNPDGEVPAFATGRTCDCQLNIGVNKIISPVRVLSDLRLSGGYGQNEVSTSRRPWLKPPLAPNTTEGGPKHAVLRLEATLLAIQAAHGKSWEDQLMVILSMAAQFSTSGLQTRIFVTGGDSHMETTIRDWAQAWSVPVSILHTRPGQTTKPSIRLMSLDRRYRAAWKETPSSAHLWLLLGSRLGRPDYASLAVERVKAVE